MPMIWLDLKEAGEFQFSPSVRQVSWVGNGATGLRSKVKPNRDYGRLDNPIKKLTLATVQSDR